MASRARLGREQGPDLAAAWLAGLVDRQGAVAYAVDPEARRMLSHGPFFYGRSAAVIRALAKHGGYPQQVARGRRWLEREIAAALSGQSVAGWPDDASAVAGTLALCVYAGLEVKGELERFITSHEDVAKSPWHAAQCVAALGRPSKPAAALWKACVRDLDARPWAPWTAIAARVYGDPRVLRRCSRTLIDSIRRTPPYVGGSTRTATPEIALTAITAQALRPLVTAQARSACRRARAFLTHHQITDRTRFHAHGAFPASPRVPYLRGDITAHALLAFLDGEPAHQGPR